MEQGFYRSNLPLVACERGFENDAETQRIAVSLSQAVVEIQRVYAVFQDDRGERDDIVHENGTSANPEVPYVSKSNAAYTLPATNTSVQNVTPPSSVIVPTTGDGTLVSHADGPFSLLRRATSRATAAVR